MTTTTAPVPQAVKPTGCCPPVDPALYQDREVVWDAKPFIKEHVRALFHIPIGFGSRMTHAMKLIEQAGAKADVPLMLTDEVSPWRSELYIDVTKPVPGAEMTTLSGTFLTKVYDGPFSQVPVWMKDMTRHVESRGKRLVKMYACYTTCPACAKAYGHNYVVMFAKVEPVVH